MNEKLKLRKIANAEVVMELWESFLKSHRKFNEMDQLRVDQDRSVMVRFIKEMKS